MTQKASKPSKPSKPLKDATADSKAATVRRLANSVSAAKPTAPDAKPASPPSKSPKPTPTAHSTPDSKRDYSQHKIALQYAPGAMNEDEFAALHADIKERGQIFPITLYEDQVLDGWHRFRACRHLGVEPKFDLYTGTDPIGFVLATNVLRRNLSGIQRALAGARLVREHGISQNSACARVGTSKQTLNLVLQALGTNSAALIRRVESGDMTRTLLQEELYDMGVTSSEPAHKRDERERAEQVRAATEQALAIATRGSAAATPATPAATPSAANTDGTAGDGTSDEDDEFFDDDTVASADDLESTHTAKPGAALDAAEHRAALDAVPGAVGKRPTHPERRATETPASVVAKQFKALSAAERASFCELTWHLLRPALLESTVDLTPLRDAAPASDSTDGTKDAWPHAVKDRKHKDKTAKESKATAH